MPGELRREAESELQAVLVRLHALRERLEDDDVQLDVLALELQDAIADIRETRAHLIDRATKVERALEAERARYHDLFDRAPDAYLVTDRSGRIISCNRAASELFQRPQPFLHGKPLPVLVADAERRLVRKKLIELGHEPLAEFELRLDTPAGELHVLVRAASENGPPPVVRWLLRDVTARKEAEEGLRLLNAELERRIADRTRELNDLNARLWTTVQQLPDGVLMFDGAGELQLANQRAEELLGRDVDALAANVDRMRASADWPLARVVATGHPSKLDRFELRHPEGTRSLLELDVVPVLSDEGIVAVLVALRDITDRERRERSERDFVTNAAHELQTPIAAIVSAVEVLQSGAKERSEDRDRFLLHIEHASARLGRLTRALLTLARAQTRSEEPRAEVIALEPLLRSVAETISGRSVEVSCAADVAVIANRPLLEQALASLGENAVKYTSGEVLLAASRANGRVSIEVVDEGPGMSDAHRAHAFERFYRGDDDSDGFGLGLAIVREAVAAIGGELELDSGPDGTRVSIRLPGARVRSR